MLGIGTVIYGEFKLLESEEVEHIEHEGTITEDYVLITANAVINLIYFLLLCFFFIILGK